MRVTRLAFLAVFVGATALVAGCGSNNKGKIVGKWKLDTLPGLDAKKAEVVKAMGVYGYLEFRADGTLVMGADSDKPGVMELAKFGNPNAQTSTQTTYKLLSGNMVEIADTPGLGANSGGIIPGGRGEIVIDGDKMTVKTSDGKSLTLTRMASTPAKPDDDKATN